ncbi:MAG: rhodanese-like domain-containing protein, partial [Flavobacteriaceae bacterium]
GALHGFEGQVSVFNYQNGPTYRCLFPKMPLNEEIPNCDENGVLGIIPGIIGNLQALEAVKMISGVGEVMAGKLLLYNGLNNTSIKVSFPLVAQNLEIRELEKKYEVPACLPAMEVTPEQLVEQLEEDENIQLYDVRSSREFSQQHLPAAINVPLEELEEHLNQLDPNAVIYFICQSGVRSRLAQQILLEHFPTGTAYSVKGGMNNCSYIFS